METPCLDTTTSSPFGGGGALLLSLSDIAVAGFIDCESSTSGTRNNVFNSDAPDDNGGSPLCYQLTASNGPTIICDLDRVCASGDTQNIGEFVTNSSYVSQSWVIRVTCDAGATEYCSVYEDTVPEIANIAVYGTDESDYLRFQTSTAYSVVSYTGANLNLALFGLAGNDVLNAGAHIVNTSRFLYGGGNADHLFANTSGATMDGGDGADLMVGSGRPNVMTGGDGGDLMVGLGDADHISSQGGADWVCGHNIDDTTASWSGGNLANLEGTANNAFDSTLPWTWQSWFTGGATPSCTTASGGSADGPSYVDAGPGDDNVYLGDTNGSTTPNQAYGGSGMDYIHATGSSVNHLCDVAQDGDTLTAANVTPVTNHPNIIAIMSVTSGPWNAAFTGNGTSYTDCTSGTGLTTSDCLTDPGLVCPFTP